jgi:L-ascorbate metabolism protein UlaG (beta-lactamase superfamily)
MELSWIGHSCFRLRGREATVVTDPVPAALGYAVGRLEADVITISHDEPNHSAVETVTGYRHLVTGPGEYEFRGVMITGVATPRPPGQSRQAPRNTAYLIEIDDLAICHLGDLAVPLTADQVAVVKDADVLLVPVGGHCTIDAAQAAEIVAQLEPRLAIPMHYRIDGIAPALDPVDRFCREMGLSAPIPQPRLNLTRGNLPEEPTVVLLEPRRPRGRAGPPEQ